MKLIILINLLFLFWLPALAGDIQVSPFSYRTSEMKSCYRWMSFGEYRRWLKKKKPVMSTIFKDKEFLNRGGNRPYGIYCWTNPVTSIRGGPIEFYGKYLARIDLKPDAVIFDRSTKTYQLANGSNEPISESEKLDVDSDVFYANYSREGISYFQEYIIKSVDSISGFTFGDEELKTQFRKELTRRNSLEINIFEYHFYFNHCTMHTTEKDIESSSSWLKNYKRYECEKYRQALEMRATFLEKFWSEPRSYNYFEL